MTIWIHWTFQNFTTMNSHVSGQMIFVLGTKRALGTMVVFDCFVDQLMGNQTAFMSKLKCKQRAGKKNHHVFSVIFQTYPNFFKQKSKLKKNMKEKHVFRESYIWGQRKYNPKSVWNVMWSRPSTRPYIWDQKQQQQVTSRRYM